MILPRSNFNALVVRANKRMRRGLALQATYAFSHSIDNASSTNAGSVVVGAVLRQSLGGKEQFQFRHPAPGDRLLFVSVANWNEAAAVQQRRFGFADFWELVSLRIFSQPWRREFR